MVWLRERISTIEKNFKPKEDYAKFIEARKFEELKKVEKELRESLTHCNNCGTRIQSKEQVVCEECGLKLMDRL